ncbi:hypothetical protein [Teredinibacter haidensis]|uniref:hypothetical protein n=1 Tax=Teredinibacter haidensis TaxID=2731755 RepID=UPI0009489CCA|nr:hypothetical protein [Teredinibacter haidensis]
MSMIPEDDVGVLEVLMKRLNTQRLPHALALEKKVDEGEVLNDFDIEFLLEVLKDVRRVKPIYDRHPDYQPILTKLMSLYTHIINRAAENESQLAHKN